VEFHGAVLDEVGKQGDEARENKNKQCSRIEIAGKVSNRNEGKREFEEQMERNEISNE
jgi:hypothetical protein